MRVLLGALLVMLSACDEARTEVPDDAKVGLFGGNPVEVGMPLALGEIGTYGGLVLWNRGPNDAVIERITPLRPSSRAEVVRIDVADLDGRAQLTGVAPTWPPKGLHLQPVFGHRVPPQDAGQRAVNVVFAVRRTGSARTIVFDGVRVDYRRGEHRLRTVIDHRLVVFEPSSAS